MSITEKHVYVSDTLPKAPERTTLAEAEADEARGVELAAYLALLPTLTEVQSGAARGAEWDAARDAVQVAVRVAGRGAALDAAWDATWGARRGAALDAARGAAAIVVRDLITPEQFDILTAPMRAAGIDFDNLVGENA